LLSGGLFLVGGMQACLWASCLLVALAFLAGIRLPSPVRLDPDQQAAHLPAQGL
jgi:hypothetical protein